MKGKSWIREQGMQDALLCAALRDRGMKDVPLWQRKFPERDAMMAHWDSLTPVRDGPVKPEPVEVTDLAAMNEEIKRRAIELGAADAGMTALKPEFIELGVDLPHKNVIAVIVYEDYAKALEGPDEVDLEAMTAYAKCADIATEIARQIREEFGYPAIAHHNGSFQIQAIPVFQEVGFGELGRHGSLIHPELGANFRPGFITTDLPVAYDTPRNFGIQDYCSTCNLCRNNCPGEAIPDDHIMTNGVKRWLTDIDKCYPISRFRESYCHICIDVCPYIWKENGDPERRSMFRDYMKIRKEEGYRTPKGPDTHPSSERAEQRGHRAIDAETHPTATPAVIADIAASALSVLAARGSSEDGGQWPGDSTWSFRAETPDGMPFDISFTGPDLPGQIAERMILPSDIPSDPNWKDPYHLTIAPPNVAFEMAWGPDDPLRILNFSRGEWEEQLAGMAG
jgi:epoxyqueuosine reductase QueG